MTNNQEENLVCAYAETLVEVLYGEATQTVQNEFADHLKSCTSCQEDFSGFGLMRSTFAEWRETELLPLESLPIELPALPAPTVLAQTGKGEKPLWLNKLRGFFASQSWSLQSAAAFAALAIFAALMFVFAFNFKDSTNDVAAVKTVENVQTLNNSGGAAQNSQPKTSYPTENPNSATNENLPQDSDAGKTNGEKSAPLNNPADSIETKINQTTIAENNPKAKSANQSVARQRSLAAHPTRPARETQARSVNWREALPEDDEDEAPRLTDLLDEVTPGG